MTALQTVLARKTRGDWIAYAFIAPAIVVLALVVGIPALTTLGFSFTDVTFLRPTEFVGLRNYLTLIGDPVFGQALWNTLYYTVGVTVPSMALGLGTAMLLNVRYPGRNVFRAILYLPVLVSIAAAAMVWIYLYDPDLGPINGLLQTVGLPVPRWLQSPSTAMPALIVMGIWRDYGTSMLLYLAGLQNVPEEVREAARIDGAGPVRTFWSVILPLLRPVTFYLVVLTVTGSFQVFGSIYIMTQGGPIGSTSTVVYQIFENAFSYSDFGYSSAMSVVLFVLILVFSIAGARIVNGRER
ncbi:carbohydrate ABC transporter permease [Microlunatus sp. GCM10028923]|uniref:carbohydrate ABC transporter permease n=1 Tax=Microlunatus sp. GCM10028923 TaxID=3273400 RepID=UPI0036183C7B